MENMLDHVEDPSQALREARRVLRPDGRLLLAVHTYSLLGETRHHVKKPFTAKQGQTFWAAHPHRFSTGEIQQLVRSAGFQVTDIDAVSRLGTVVGRGYLTRLLAQCVSTEARPSAPPPSPTSTSDATSDARTARSVTDRPSAA